MRIEIFYPTNHKYSMLKKQSYLATLTDLFGGITTIPNCLGLFKEKKTDPITVDSIETWIIYCDLDFFKFHIPEFQWILADMKATLEQTCIAYGIIPEAKIELY